MKIATRTAALFTLFSACILILFSLAIFLLTERNRYDEFNDRLRFKITWRAEFFFNAHFSEQEFRDMHEHNKKVLHEAQLSIFDQNLNLIYADEEEEKYSTALLGRLKKDKKIVWERGDQLFMGITYSYKNTNYYLIGHAYDITGFQHVEQIRKNLIILFCITLFLIFVCSFLFASYILEPIKAIIRQIREISERNLHKRLYHRKAKDELQELIRTSNVTFDRLEKSFKNQQHFVSIISHEFRTPLSTIITELELAKVLNLTVKDYEQTIENVLTDAREASTLSAALLDFARANYDSSQISFEEIRIDEILIEAQMQITNKNYTLLVEFDESNGLPDPDTLVIYGNTYLLKVAFSNLFENGCKYSLNQKCRAIISNRKEHIIIEFVDQGIGIPKADVPHVFDLFYRSSNTSTIAGNGIGLSIVQRIIGLHHGEIEIDSIVNRGSTFRISIPKKHS